MFNKLLEIIYVYMSAFEVMIFSRRSIGVSPLLSMVSRHPQFLSVWCPPICGHPIIFDHLSKKAMQIL